MKDFPMKSPYLWGVAIMLLLAIAMLATPAAEAQAISLALPPQQAVDNSACLACHSQPGLTMTLPDGTVLPVTVDETAYTAAVHAGLTCNTCHAGYESYPHPEKRPATWRVYAFWYKDTCETCHADQHAQWQLGVHGILAGANHFNAAICTDCHNPHSQMPVRDEAGNLLPAEAVKIPRTCQTCHSTIYDEYAKSVHGKAVLEGNNPDVPTCVDCHGVHNIADATTAEYRLNSPQMCSNCHTDPERMAKYGLNTDVLNTYISDFHGTTVTLFEKVSPGMDTNKPVCYDCHGVHDIRAVDDPEKGISVKANLAVTCQRCHPNADVVNFPDSWLGHYSPSLERTPITWIVNLAYTILIPTVIGAMLIFNLSDAYRRIRHRRRPADSPAETEGEAADEETKTE